MARMDDDAQRAADDAEVEKMREKFGDAEAAKLAADLYKIRRTPQPPPTGYSFGQFPRGIVILIALWVGLLETADKLPKLLLTIPQYEAARAEFQAKLVQPDLAAAQLERAKQEAKASQFQPDLASTQLQKSKYDAEAAAVQPFMAATQLERARYETKAAAISPDAAAVQLDKAKSEAKAAKWQPLATAAQGLETEGRFMANGNLTSAYTGRMSSVMGRLKPLDDF